MARTAETRSDLHNLRRVAIGDVEGIEPLYERFAGRTFAVCLEVLEDPAQAEDALRETFLEVWRRAGEYDPEHGGVGNWIAKLGAARSMLRAAR